MTRRIGLIAGLVIGLIATPAFAQEGSPRSRTDQVDAVRAQLTRPMFCLYERMTPDERVQVGKAYYTERSSDIGDANDTLNRLAGVCGDPQKWDQPAMEHAMDYTTHRAAFEFIETKLASEGLAKGKLQAVYDAMAANDRGELVTGNRTEAADVRLRDALKAAGVTDAMLRDARKALVERAWMTSREQSWVMIPGVLERAGYQ